MVRAMNKVISLGVVLFMGISMVACKAKEASASNGAAVGQEKTVRSTVVMKDTKIRKMALGTADLNFTFDAEDNETVRALAMRFPLKLRMSDLNGNEKYAYLSEPLPAQPESVGRIRAGDVMLFGDNCLVVFYKDFETTYRYTRIGHIENGALLVEALGTGDVEVTLGR
jgi:hypothetical protein